MKIKKIYRNLVIVLTVLFNFGCADYLEENPYSQLAPENFLKTREGIESLMGAAYANASNMISNNSIYTFAADEWTTDFAYQTGDGVNATAVQYINFTWDASIGLLQSQNWDYPYRAIRNANLVLENLDELEASESLKTLYTAEARFIRATCYIKLYWKFGPVPLRLSTEDDVQLPRASSEELANFIETELLAALEDLPDPGQEANYGRAHKAAAQGWLSNFYLNNKEWQKSAEFAGQIMNQWNYELFPIYEDLFKVENEINSEYIWVRPAKTSADRRASNSWMNTAFPVGFAKDPRTGLEFSNAWRNWPNESRIRDKFYFSFDEDDRRRDLILHEYINTDGELISLLDEEDNTRSFKYWPDPEGVNASFGNDIPEIRFAEILLNRAEALNELNGVNQESIDLINRVRERAGITTPLSLNDFSSKEELRMQVLDERGWEFYSEGKRRLDLIRMDKLIEFAHARGATNAKPYHRLYPIPFATMDANPLLVQNEGY
ncbi:RagB/SusD family nutrient uptake outer membrane protein [Cyclobacterium sp. 1_MG-2023]|uniref:RagB/SusD family nutrient uptake outer membrane protein n=1 Tax=Cyclobacterium sp. 1_MG-2023 TaxID=3062681 RepID=UPI0026E2B617|nr:RagB/SusD family nutrient uptake outer membrane protein [Cyclobacterium sp. 1_MG-2023]MDO6436093.1 RagB/SusD family nutrient uptake outer membrane protein [Cyclobacterium sp. 1_MG-2023]